MAQLPQIPTPTGPASETMAVRAIKQILDMMLGRGNTPLSTTVTWQDLVSAGLVTEAQALAAIQRNLGG